MKIQLFLLLSAVALSVCSNGKAQEIRDSVKIHFRQDYSTLDMDIGDNRAVLGRITDKLSSGYADSVYRLKKIEVVGGASPEGTIMHNRRLSAKRARRLFDYLRRYGELPDSLTTFTFLGRDWHGLVRLVEADDNVPYKQETLDFLYDILSRLDGGEKVADNNVGRLSRFKRGRPYKYMYNVLFPELRASKLLLWYDRIWNPVKFIPVVLREDTLMPPPPPALTPIPAPLAPKPFYMAVKTNMLYDALLVREIARYEPSLCVLSGFMRILTPIFTRHVRAINIHPSFLPHHKGAHAIRDSFYSTQDFGGVSVHWVSDELDSGALIAQEKLPKIAGESLQSFESRIHELEYRLFPQALLRALNLRTKG